jgi:hypothetical protein
MKVEMKRREGKFLKARRIFGIPRIILPSGVHFII